MTHGDMSPPMYCSIRKKVFCAFYSMGSDMSLRVTAANPKDTRENFSGAQSISDMESYARGSADSRDCVALWPRSVPQTRSV